jgi:hypothetical protein
MGFFTKPAAWRQTQLKRRKPPSTPPLFAGQVSGAPTSRSSRNIKFTERFNGQFRFETFNTFNHTNPICCGSTNFTSTLYNTVTSTRDPRILQLGMKLNF